MGFQAVNHAYNDRMAGFHTTKASSVSASSAQSAEKSADFDQYLSTSRMAGSDRSAGLSQMKDTAETGEKWSFFDFLDIINPLQHIPIISTIYRSVTGDEIKTASRAIGGMLYGGPVGMASGIVNGAVADSTGKDIPETLIAMATGKHGEKGHPHDAVDNTIMLAQAKNAAEIMPAAGQNQHNQTQNKTGASPTTVSTLPDTSTTLSHSQKVASKTATAEQKFSASHILGQDSQIRSQTISEQHTLLEGGEKKSRKTVSQPESLSKRNTSEADRTQEQPAYLPPELVAQQMMSALDQYADMKKGQM